MEHQNYEQYCLMWSYVCATIRGQGILVFGKIFHTYKINDSKVIRPNFK